MPISNYSPVDLDTLKPGERVRIYRTWWRASPGADNFDRFKRLLERMEIRMDGLPMSEYFEAAATPDPPPTTIVHNPPTMPELKDPRTGRMHQPRPPGIRFLSGEGPNPSTQAGTTAYNIKVTNHNDGVPMGWLLGEDSRMVTRSEMMRALPTFAENVGAVTDTHFEKMISQMERTLFGKHIGGVGVASYVFAEITDRQITRGLGTKQETITEIRALDRGPVQRGTTKLADFTKGEGMSAGERGVNKGQAPTKEPALSKHPLTMTGTDKEVAAFTKQHFGVSMTRDQAYRTWQRLTNGSQEEVILQIMDWRKSFPGATPDKARAARDMLLGPMQKDADVEDFIKRRFKKEKQATDRGSKALHQVVNANATRMDKQRKVGKYKTASVGRQVRADDAPVKITKQAKRTLKRITDLRNRHAIIRELEEIMGIAQPFTDVSVARGTGGKRGPVQDVGVMAALETDSMFASEMHALDPAEFTQNIGADDLTGAGVQRISTMEPRGAALEAEKELKRLGRTSGPVAASMEESAAGIASVYRVAAQHTKQSVESVTTADIKKILDWRKAGTELAPEAEKARAFNKILAVVAGLNGEEALVALSRVGGPSNEETRLALEGLRRAGTRTTSGAASALLAQITSGGGVGGRYADETADTVRDLAESVYSGKSKSDAGYRAGQGHEFTPAEKKKMKVKLPERAELEAQSILQGRQIKHFLEEAPSETSHSGAAGARADVHPGQRGARDITNAMKFSAENPSAVAPTARKLMAGTDVVSADTPQAPRPLSRDQWNSVHDAIETAKRDGRSTEALDRLLGGQPPPEVHNLESARKPVSAQATQLTASETSKLKSALKRAGMPFKAGLAGAAGLVLMMGIGPVLGAIALAGQRSKPEFGVSRAA